MADQFKVNGADYTSAADALAAAVPDADGNISITAINGDLTLDNSVAATGKVTLRVASAEALIAGEDVSSTITITSDFASKLDMQAGTASEDDPLQGCTGENAPYRIIFDGANVTAAAGFYSYNYGYVELKNGAQYLGNGGDSHVRGSVLVTGEGTLLSAAFLSVYAADFGSTKPYAASMVVKDGATLFATTERSDANTFKIGHASKAYRGGELIIEGGIVKSNTDIVVNAGGTISLSNSTVNGKVNYGQIILTEKSASKLVTTNAAAGAVTISLKSADYANCDASYKIIDVQNTTALDLSKVTITLDGAAYTLGTTFGGSYSIKQVDNDLVLYYDDPYMLSSQNFVTDTTLSGTDKAYYRNPDESYSGFSSIYNVGSGSTLTIAKGVTVDLERNASGTKSIILVGANDYFASQGFEATGAGDLVVNGTLDVGQLNAMADGTITVNGELNITTACIEKGALIYNTGSTGLINCLNIFNNANATVTVNGLATLTLAGEPAHALKDNGATDTASRFVVNVTDADLAAMTGDTHTILDVKSSDVSIADKFTVKVNGTAYTLGEQFTTASGDTYVINMGDADGDSTANDLLVTMTEKAPEPVIPEEPGEGGEGSEGGMEIAAQNPPVFINPKYSEKSTGKKVNGVELEYGVNAFSSIEDAKAALGADAAVSMVMSKSAKFDSESDLSGISEIAGNSPVEKIRKTSATIKSTPKKSLTLNGTTAAATGFRQFARVKVLNGANIGGDIINEKYTVKYKGTLDANGEWLDGVATTTNAAAGTLKVTDSTIANAFGFKSVKLTNSQAGILGVNPVAKEVSTIEGGAVASSEIVKEKRVGSVTAKNSIVDSVMDYKTLKLQGESAVASIVNVQNVTISGKADVQINDLTDTAILNNKLTIGSKAIVDLGIGNFGAGNDKMIIGSKATVYADSLDFGEGKDSLKISGTLVLENGMLEGIEKISGRGEIATTAAYADALDERFDDIFGGEILDLGNTVANFRGTRNELADNTEKKALKWNSAEGELGGWLGIGDDVDCIDSVDFVKITASKDGTLEISSADWSGSSDIVTLDGVKLDISGGSASFGITAGEDYLLKVERKDSNSMSYDIKLA